MSSPELQYALATAPNTVTVGPSIATLNLLVSNASQTAVGVTSIAIYLPWGSGAADLTTDTSVTAVPPDGWQSTQAVANDYLTVTFIAPVNTTVTSDALQFVLEAVTINSQPGGVAIGYVENGVARGTLNLTKFPPSWSEVQLRADNAYLVPPANPVLNWNGPAGATYTLEYVNSDDDLITLPLDGEPALAHTGSYPASSAPGLNLQQTTVFTLSVSEVIDGIAYRTQAQQTISVTPVELTASASNLYPPGNPTLSWKGGNPNATYTLKWGVQSVSLPGGGSGSYPATGGDPLCLPETTTFTLVVSDNGYDYDCQTTVTIAPQPQLTANAEQMSAPANPVLSWSHANPDKTYTLEWGVGNSKRLSPGDSGKYPGSGDPALNLTQTTTFTLNTDDDGCSSQTPVTATVLIPVVSSFTASSKQPETDSNGILRATVNLAWETTDADSVTIFEQGSTQSQPTQHNFTYFGSYDFYPPDTTTTYKIIGYSDKFISETQTVTTTTYVPSPTIQGSISGTGGSEAGTNYTCSRTATGCYTVTFEPTLKATPIVTTSVIYEGIHATVANLSNVTAASFDVVIRSTASQDAIDMAFMFMASVPPSG